jgi:hypothetical protein
MVMRMIVMMIPVMARMITGMVMMVVAVLVPTRPVTNGRAEHPPR